MYYYCMYRITIFPLVTICSFYLTLNNGHLLSFHHGIVVHDPEGQSLDKYCLDQIVAAELIKQLFNFLLLIKQYIIVQLPSVI